MMGRIFLFAGVLIMIMAITAQITDRVQFHQAELKENELKMEEFLLEAEYPITVISSPPAFPCSHKSYLLIDSNGVTWNTGEIRYSLPYKIRKR